MNKELKRCPYCSRKINYGRRLLESSKGEHICKHCKKNSNIKQNPLIWIILIICCLFSLSVMIFYFSSAKNIQDTYDDTGKMKFLVTVFFGTFKEIKWIFWEIFPFIVLYFITPLFIEFYPQKKFMEQTQTNIDLSIPLSNTASMQKVKADGKSNKFAKIKEPEFTGVYEDISSSSDIGKTRAFSVSDANNLNDHSEYYKDEIEKEEEIMTDINSQKNSVSRSYSSDTPLIKVSHTSNYQEQEEVKEYIPSKERVQDAVSKASANDKNTHSNYSANRKF